MPDIALSGFDVHEPLKLTNIHHTIPQQGYEYMRVYISNIAVRSDLPQYGNLETLRRTLLKIDASVWRVCGDDW